MREHATRANVGGRQGRDAKLLLTRAEAAEVLSMGLTSFARYVQPQIALVHRGRMRLVPIKELERWVARNSQKVWPE